MNYLRREKQRLLFELRSSERDVFKWVLRLYPVMPADHFRVTRTPELDPDGERQQLLTEAANAQRQENKQRIQKFLKHPKRFELQDEHWLLRLTDAEADWLLEVLNEVRVGSWVQLGSPEQGAEAQVALTSQTMRHLWAMELAGHLESQVLEALTSQS